MNAQGVRLGEARVRRAQHIRDPMPRCRPPGRSGVVTWALMLTAPSVCFFAFLAPDLARMASAIYPVRESALRCACAD